MFRQVIEKALSDQGVKLPFVKTDTFLTASDDDDTWTLKIGDQITLYMNEDLDNVTGSGRCTFMSASGIDSLNAKCGGIECRNKQQLPPNFKECVFVVCNQMNYSAAKAYYKKLESLGRENKSIASSSTSNKALTTARSQRRLSNVSGSSLMLGTKKSFLNISSELGSSQRNDSVIDLVVDDSELQLQTFKLKMEKEREQNLVEAERSTGKEVVYGQGIQLLHIKTNKFLTVARESAEIQKDCMRLTLDEYGNANSIFHIVPYYSYRTEGQKVLISDQVRLLNAGSNQYVHLSTFMYKNDTRSLREINMSTDTNFTRWRMRLYTPVLDISTLKLLKAGDIVRLYHTDAAGYLSVDTVKGNLVKIESDSESNAKSSSNTMWEVEMFDISRGGLVEWNCNYRLKHSATNKYMTVRVPVMNDEDDEDEDDSSSVSSFNSDRLDFEDSGKDTDDELNDSSESPTPSIPTPLSASTEDASLNSATNEDDSSEGYLTPRSRERRSLSSARMMGSMFDVSRGRAGSMQNNLPKISKWNILKKQILKDASLLAPNQAQEVSQRFELFVDDAAASSTLFSLFPPDDASGAVPLDSFMRVKHHQTSSWLHSIKSTAEEEAIAQSLKLKRTESKQYMFSPSTMQNNVQKKKKRRFYRIDTRMEMSEEDVFVIKSVPKTEIDDLLFIQATIPVIDSLIHKLSNNFTLKRGEITNVTSVLAQLILFCTESDIQDPFRREGIPYTNRQNYIRELNVLDKIMEIFNLMIDNNYINKEEIHEEKNSAFKDLMRHGYRLIKQACKLNNENGLYMSPYISFIQSQIESNIGGSAALAEILSNNYELLNKITEEEIKYFMKLLVESNRNPDYLSFLSTLCDVDGKPVAKNQDVITQLLFSEESDAKHTLLIPYQSPDDKIMIKINDMDVEFSKFTTGVFGKYNTSRSSLDSLLFIESTVELLGKLCMGRNAKSIAIVTSMLSFELVLECIQDEDLPPRLRSHFCNLLLFAYIDTAPYEKKPLITLTRNWTPKMTLNAQEKRKQAKRGSEKMKELKGFIDYYFSNHYELDKAASQTENNRFTLTMARICKTLFEFGIYKEMEEIEPLINKLFNVLDGKTDRNNMKVLQDNERFVLDEQNVVISAIKLEICKLFDMIFDIAQDRRITYFIEAFKHRVEIDSAVDVIEQDKRDNMLLKKLFAYNKKGEKPSTIMDSPEFKQKFYAAMQDLMNYENNELANKAMNLLFRAHHQKEELSELLPKIELLVSRQMVRSYGILSKTTSKLRQVLAGESYIRLRGEEAKKVRDLIESMINDVKENGHRSQRIMRNLQVHDIALSLLYSNFSDFSAQQMLWRCATRLLSQFVAGSSENQQIMFRHVDFLITKLGVIPEICSLLCDIFRNNRVLCSTIEERTIRSFIDAIAENGLSARYLVFLRAIVSMNGRPLKRNQTLITENLMERKKDVMKLFNDEEGIIERNKRIEQNEHVTKPDGILNYHFALLQLLCDCADGKNHVSEVKLQALLSIDSVLDQLTESVLIPQLRDPLIRFLDEVYVNTEKENPKLQTSSKLWVLFERMNKELEFYISNPKLARTESRSVILPESIPVIEEQLDLDNPRESFRLTNEQKGQVDNHYIFKLMIPLVHHYFHKHYPPPTVTEHQEEITRQLIMNFTELYTKTANPNHREAVKRCVQAMYKKRLNVKGNAQVHIQNFLVKLMADTAKPVQIFREKASRYEDKDEQIYTQYLAYIRLLKAKFTAMSDMKNIANLYTAQKDLNTLVRVLRRMVSIGSYDEGTTFATVSAIKSLQTVMENIIEKDDDEELNMILIQMVIADVPSLVLELVCSNVNVIVKEALQLGILILVDGNDIVQKNVFNVFHNSQSEQFFIAVRDRIRLAIQEIKVRSDFTKKQKLRKTAIEESSVVINLSELQKKNAKNNMKAITDKVAQAIGDVELEDQTGQVESTSDKFVETGYIEKILRFLQLMCEGHNLDLQNYLNAQPSNSVSVNIVQECLNYLLSLEKFLDPQTLGIAIQTLDTLIEFIQGPCQSNQQVIGLSPTFYFASNEMLQMGSSEEYPLLVVLKLRFKIILSMISLLEGNRDRGLSTLMRNSLNINLLQGILLKCARVVAGLEDEELHRRSRRDYNNALQRDEESPTPSVLFGKMKKYYEKLGLHIYFLLNIFIDERLGDETANEGLVEWMVEHRDRNGKLSAFKNATGRIEVLFRNNLERVYFRKPDISNNMIEETKQDFIFNCDRETAQSKVIALFQETNKFRMEMEHYEEFRVTSKDGRLEIRKRAKAFAWNFVEKYWDTMRRLFFFYAILLNIVMCTTYKKSYDTLQGPVPVPGFSTSDNLVLTGAYSIGAIEYVMLILGIIQLILTVFFFVIYMYFYAKLKVKKQFEQKTYTKWDKMETNLDFIWRYFIYSVKDKQMWSHLLTFGISLIAFVVSPLVYCLLLFEIVVRAQTLFNVLRAIRYNYVPLLLTAILMVVSMFLFSVMYFSWRDSDFALNDGDPVICESSLLTCFVGILNYGFRSGGFWEDITPASLSVLRFFIDMSFYIVVVTVLISVVFGIILDSFDNLREENYETEQAVKERCFICDIEKSRFDMKANEGITFERHVKQEHYMWNYVFFLIYLLKKKKTEYTGIEQDIANLVAQDDTSFFPILRSLTLEESDAMNKSRLQSLYFNSNSSDNGQAEK